ncbi:hypothetical protein D0A34_21495 [Microcoleus vaginatus PCC 9802]|nr:hypothetical protein D0A34_21495 [Microcoleus vaginatus PCC 9802]
MNPTKLNYGKVAAQLAASILGDKQFDWDSGCKPRFNPGMKGTTSGEHYFRQTQEPRQGRYILKNRLFPLHNPLLEKEFQR